MTEKQAILLTKTLLKKYGIYGYSVQIMPQRKLQGVLQPYDPNTLVLGQNRHVFVSKTKEVRKQIFLWEGIVKKGSREQNKQNILHELTHVIVWEKLGVRVGKLLNRHLGEHGIHFWIVGLFIGLNPSEKWKETMI